MWHVAHDRWGYVNLLWKLQLPISYGLGVKVFWRYFHKGWLTDWVNYEGVCRTAPATSGLLKIFIHKWQVISKYDQRSCYSWRFNQFQPCQVAVEKRIFKVHIFSPTWERLCLLRLVDRGKALSHWEQTNAFSPVWWSLCLFKSFDEEKALPQMMQLNGFSPVWKRKCLFWLSDLKNALSQRVPPNCLFPVWRSLCFFRLSKLERALLHWAQTNCFSPVWVFMCIFRLSDLVKALSHSLQINRFQRIGP